MNAQHLRAFLWLRWRLRINQLKRGGTANAVILTILMVGAFLLGAILFVVFFLLGLSDLGHGSPAALLYVWDGLVAVFLFAWATGLLADLQRAEALSLEKFLHLPVSLAGVFLINYLSSLLSLNLILFVPAMVGLSLGLVGSRGPAMLWLLPLVAAFLLMVTALTYQFQGWLAALMVNKRRRQTIIVVITAAFLLLTQLPNLLNFLHPWESRQPDQLLAQRNEEQEELQRLLASGKITPAEFHKRQEESQREYLERQEQSNRQKASRVEQTVWLVNLVVPPGWLPLGALAVAQGNLGPALLSILGLTLLGMASLGRSYRTTVRLYTGQYTSGRRQQAAAAAAPPSSAAPSKLAGHLLERQLPRLSQQTSVIALASFRSLLRAAEGKMMLLSPILMVVVFGAMFLARTPTLPPLTRPLVALGAMALVLVSMIQLIGNQFGFDRGGFRVYVLCPAPRRDILLGKNLAFAPVALGLGTVSAAVIEGFYPMRLDYLLALVPQFLSMYLIFCLLANWLSILVPMHIAPGSFRPTNVKLLPVLLQLLFFFLFPVVLAPTLLPFGLEVLLDKLGWIQGVPLCLLLSLAECVVVVYLYRLLLAEQGRLLQNREQKILEIVTTKAE